MKRRLKVCYARNPGFFPAFLFVLMSNIKILDATPSMADVVSGAVPRPRERRLRENAFQWLKTTPAWRRLIEEFGLDDFWPGAEYRPDLKPPASLGLEEFPHIYSVTWHKPPKWGSLLLLVNTDGTRCALIDLIDEVARLWNNVQRPHAGRPRIETDNPETLYKRQYRENRRYCSVCLRDGRKVEAWKDRLCEQCWHRDADAKATAI